MVRTHRTSMQEGCDICWSVSLSWGHASHRFVPDATRGRMTHRTCKKFSAFPSTLFASNVLQLFQALVYTTVNIASEMHVNASCLTAYCNWCNTPMIQALYQALQMSVPLGKCIWDPIYQGSVHISCYCDCFVTAGGIMQMGLLLVWVVLVEVEPAQNSYISPKRCVKTV